MRQVAKIIANLVGHIYKRKQVTNENMKSQVGPESLSIQGSGLYGKVWAVTPMCHGSRTSSRVIPVVLRSTPTS